MSIGIITDVIKNCTTSTTSRPNAELVERQNRKKPAALQKVKVEKLPQGSVWFSVDNKKEWSPYLKDTPKINKRCDYVILSKVDEVVHLIFVELKSGSVSDDISEKFKSTECFMDYCESICKRLFAMPFLKTAQKRFVVFAKGAEQKTPTRFNGVLHDQPETPKLIINPNRVKFKQLIR